MEEGRVEGRGSGEEGRVEGGSAGGRREGGGSGGRDRVKLRACARKHSTHSSAVAMAPMP